MANIKSQIKRVGTNEKARIRNASAKSAIRTAIKKVKAAAAANDKAAAEEASVVVEGYVQQYAYSRHCKKRVHNRHNHICKPSEFHISSFNDS